MTTTARLSWLNRINVTYGVIGLLAIVEFSAPGAWKSFMAGWAVSVINFEFLKRIGMLMAPLYRVEGAGAGEQSAGGKRVSPMVYGLLIGKFAFWGLVIAILVTVTGIQAIPFVAGMLTILVAGIALGVKEVIHARA